MPNQTYFSLLDKRKSKTLLNIRYLYGLNENVNESILNSYFDLSDQDSLDAYKLQDILVELLVNNTYLAKYRPYHKYRKSFFKSIINTIEKLNNEVNESLYNEYINSMNEQSDADQKNQTYFLIIFSKHGSEEECLDERPIVIEQYSSIIANGTTGLHVWPASFQLIEYFYKNESLLENK
jgi:hypothetical protein